MHKRISWLNYLLLAVPLLTIVAYQASSNSAKEVPQKDDAAIQKCISEKLASSPSLKSQNISATVSGGVATLTGKVSNAGSKGAATNLAKGCGAKTVTNQITVGVDDDAIQKCITDKFAASPSLKTQGFAATVSGGVATLTGTAKDAGSKGAATNIAKKCGAKSVTNNISSPAVAKPKGTATN